MRRGGQRKVFNHFNILFANRLVFYQNKPVVDREIEHLKEAPEVSEKSRMIAEEARRKKYGEAAAAAESGDFVSYIYAKDQAHREIKEAKAEEYRQAREEYNSHKPQTLDYQFKNERITSGDRGLDLYNTVGKGDFANK